MNFQSLRRVSVTAALTALLAMVGCGGGGASKHATPSAETPKLTKIAITGGTGNLEIGTTRQYSATGSYSDGSSQDLTSSLSWTTSNPSVAKVSAGLVTAVAAGSSTVSASFNDTSSTASIVVNPSLSNVIISPANFSPIAGTSQSLTATGIYSDASTKDLTADVLWSTSDPLVATVDVNGQITLLAAGDCVVTATIKGVTVSINIHVSASRTLVSIEMSGVQSSPVAGRVLQLSATGTYSDSTSQDLSNMVSWTSSDTSLATVDASGLVTLVAAGDVDISGTLNGVTASMSFHIKPYLVSIDVLPSNPAIELGTTQQLMASGNYSDGSQQDLTDQVQWSSTDPLTATVDEHGLASAAKSGSTTMTALLNDVSGSSNFVVNPPHLTSIVIDQDGTTIANGLTQSFTAMGVFSDDSTAPLTGVTFTSSDSSIVSIDENGVAVSHGVGTVTITASYGSVTATATFTISPATLVSIASNPGSKALPLGLKQQLSVVGTFTDSTNKAITESVVWTSSDLAVATVDENGLVSTIGVGTATITATVGAFTSSSTIDVNAAELVSVAVTPNTATMPAGATQQFVATGTYTDGSTHDLTTTAQWISSDGSLVNITDTGLATGLTSGTVTVTAYVDEFSDSASLQITSAIPTSLVITPQNVSAAKGTTVQFKATVYFSDGTSRDMTKLVTWSSSLPATVNINNSGLATAHKLGSVTIGARLSNQAASTTMTVVP